MPNLVEREIAKRRVQYEEGLFHFAVAGVAGSGKSSLINAFRGLRNREAGAATTGITETTRVFDRCPDPDPQQPVVWYDIPGANTLNIPDWQYFNAQGLYVFDCIIVLFDNRFTMTDIAILGNCARFGIPCYIVRSKADQHIRNMMKEMGYNSDDEDSDPGSRNRLYGEARQHFIDETRRNVRSNLENANLPDRRVYIVSNDTLLSVIRGETPRRAIDEIELRRDIVGPVLARRGIVSNTHPATSQSFMSVIPAEAELRWKKGIRPVVTPSLEELKKAKERIQYQEGFFHFAVTGVAGSGKSSLVNAFRGLRNRDAGAAATGVTETTLEIARYSDPNHNHQLLWFDIPGAGTLKVPDWQYFNEHGLYVFDCIIVLFDARFTMTDIAILSSARRFNIPAYIVRSKADQNIRNIMRDMGYDSDEDEEDSPGRRNKLYKAARKQYIEKTRESVKINLENANLPDQRVYLVSNDTMLSCTTTQRLPKKVIDEIELLTDIYTQVVSRRSLPREDDGLLSSLRSAKGN
ncbi:interferon-inducible GTPase-domain-containing protein [Pisolithus tinctorius]|nr:interferon-inducible GTPase-domain-containing protein [Pisolithus tinctorius]